MAISNKTRELLLKTQTKDQGGDIRKAENLLEFISQQGQNPALIPIPKLSETKELIASRGTLLDELQNISTDVGLFSSKVEDPTLKSFFKEQEIPFEVLRKGALSSIVAYQAAESGFSGALLAGLEGKPENMVKEFLKGVSGQKITRISDLVEATNVGGDRFNKPIAATFGLLSVLGLSQLAASKQISAGVIAMNQAVKRSVVKGIRKKMGFFKDQADRFIKGFDEAFTNMRGEFNKLYGKIGNRTIGGDDAIALQDAVTRLPKDVANKLNKIEGINFLDKFQTLLKPNVNNAKLIKTQIGKTIPRKVWNGLDDGGTNAPLFRELKDSYFKLNDVIANNAGSAKPQLLKLNAKFSRLHTFSERLQPILRKSTGTTKTTIRGISSESMQGDLDEVIRFSNGFFKEGREVIKGIDKMNKSIQFHKGVKAGLARVGPAAVAGGVGASVGVGLLRKPILKALSGDSAPRGGGGG